MLENKKTRKAKEKDAFQFGSDSLDFLNQDLNEDLNKATVVKKTLIDDKKIGSETVPDRRQESIEEQKTQIPLDINKINNLSPEQLKELRKQLKALIPVNKRESLVNKVDDEGRIEINASVSQEAYEKICYKYWLENGFSSFERVSKKYIYNASSNGKEEIRQADVKTSFYDIVDNLISNFNENKALVYGHGEVIKVTDDLKNNKANKDQRLVLRLQKSSVEKMDRIIQKTHEKVMGYRSSFINALLKTSIEIEGNSDRKLWMGDK